ncbi:Flp pilus assembly protein TadD, contains TPR repeats [Roseivivax marinus]|uniref:tetratricopeptide repeat protein n=1 Tax=Roseivivax marinus TaxID=1379903 RepID=UPI0008C9A8D1|nr:tetratricopeptide repeat protein [Roseivivax marinus]SEK57150.1 Flp pilus assembly protein TadD, contains TPR repeats [Roseivivax marinus]
MAAPARDWIRGAALALVLAAPGGAMAQGFAGDYLAARQASIFGDFEAAARYYDRTIARDNSRPELLERSIFAHMALGEFDRAGSLGDRLTELGQSSRIAQMAMIADRLSGGDYAGTVAMIEDGKGVGTVVDGLIGAWALLGEGDMSAALVAFDEVAQMQGLAPLASYHKALALASVGDYEGAQAIFASGAMGSVQGTRRAIMAHAEVLSQLDRTDEALALLNDSFGPGIDPGLRALRDSLESGEALPFTHAQSARDGLAEVFYTLAGAFSSEMSSDFLLIYSRIATELRPDHIDAQLLTAELYDEVGQFDLAVEAYRQVPRDDPSFHAAELGRAESLRRSGRDDAAVEVLESLADSHGDLPVVMSALGDTYRTMERFEAAVDAYTAALDLFAEPDTAQWFLYYARGISQERQGNWDEAESDFRAALELNPEQPQVLNYLGYSLVEQQENLDEALAMIERAVEIEPNSGYIVDSLGWVLYRLGRYDEAVGHMERAAELMPIDPVVNDHLGDVYWAVGRELEAEFMWNRALSFVDAEDVSQDADPDRIRRKLEVGLDTVLAEEGSPPLDVAADEQR